MTAPPTQSPWSRGTVIGDRYRLVELIGAGAMAEVWRAEHVTLETPVAVKLVSVEQDARAEETMERFLREAKAAAKLRSPHVVQMLDHGRQDQSAYIAMELLEGESLRDRLDRERVLAPLQVARIGSELARGLEIAHAAGIVHRDLKPENVFLAREHGREVVKILDFGIAKRLDLQGVDRLATQEGFMVGTPCYMSPEQILGTGTIDGRSDLWQMAIVIFECLCGRRPFDSDAIGDLMMRICSGPIPVPSAVAPVPPGFDEWFARAAMREPSARFASPAEMAEALVALLAPHTTAAALADSLPAWVPPAQPSAPGAFEASYSGSFDPAQSRLGTSARQTWATAGRAGEAGSRRRLVLTAVLVGAPLAAIVATALILLLSTSEGETAGPAAAGTGAPRVDGSSLESERASGEATTTATSATASAGSSTSAADAGADAGSAPPRRAPALPPTTAEASPKLPTPPRRARPEDVLGI